MKTFLCEESVLRHNKTNCFPSYLDHYLNQIIILEKRIIRIISIVSFDSHTSVLLKEILKFSDIYVYQIGKFMHFF